jgi:hypothetical protein
MSERDERKKTTIVSRTKWGSKYGPSTHDAAPVPLPKPQAMFARLKHPRERGMYYNNVTGTFVERGWTVWKMKDWEAKFGFNFDPALGVDTQGRHWEFFGYTIPLIKPE